jgi:hypothetical protein
VPWPLNSRRRALLDDPANAIADALERAVELAERGEQHEARELNEATLARCRRLFGRYDPRTLALSDNLAINLAELGEHQQARELHEDTLARRRRTLGDDDPDTLTTVRVLVADLRALGESERSAALLAEFGLAP